jgi:hypothetical protein
MLQEQLQAVSRVAFLDAKSWFRRLGCCADNWAVVEREQMARRTQVPNAGFFDFVDLEDD